MGTPRARLVRELAIPGLPPPVSHYADATIAGGLLFVSGLLAVDEQGTLVGAGDAAAQAEHIFATLVRILDQAGANVGDVAKLTLFLVDLADRAKVNEVRKRVFGQFRPASTLVEVSGLVGAGTLIEIEAVAAVR